jgi:hypothetical protein
MGITSKGIKNFKTKVKVESAIKLTHDNLDDAADWCGGMVVSDSKASDPTDVYRYVKVPSIYGPLTAEIGSYIVKDDHGRFRIEVAEDYEETMEPFVTRDQGIGLEHTLR